MESVTRDALPTPTPEVAHVDSITVDSTSPMIQVVDLPSKFLPYPAGSTISYKPYGYGELEQLSANNSFRTKVELCLAGIETVGFKKTVLDFQDFVYIMVLRKLSTFSTSKFTLKVTCPHCDQYMVTNRDLNSIEFSEIEKIPALPIKYEVDGVEMDFMPLTISDVLNMNLGDELSSEPITLKLSYMARNLPQPRAYELISQCATGEDIQTLDLIHELLDFGSQTTEIKCVNKECGKDVKITLRGVSKLAEPFRTSKDALRNRIVFGSKSHS